MRFLEVIALLAASFAAVGAAPITKNAVAERDAAPAADPKLDKKGYGSYSPYASYGKVILRKA